MTTILSVSSIPFIPTNGNWPRNHMNTGKWGFTFTPSHTPDYYPDFAHLFANGVGALTLYSEGLMLIDQASSGGAFAGITWEANQAIRVVIDVPNHEMTVSGAATGDGVYAIAGSGPFFNTGSLGVGCYTDGNVRFTGTISNVDDAT